MDKRGKNILLFSAFLIAIFIITLYFAFAAFYGIPNEPQDSIIQEDEETRLNFSLVNPEPIENITHLNLTLPENFTMNPSTSGTNAPCSFSNTTNGSSIVLEWKNSTLLIPNGSDRTFWINITSPVPGNFNLTIDARYSNTSIETQLVYNAIFVNDTQSPVVNNLTAPPNNAVYNDSTVFNFSCNASDDGGIIGIALFMMNDNGPWIINETYAPDSLNNLSGIYNQTNFSQTVMYPGNYQWVCRAWDSYGHEMDSPINNITVNSFSLTGFVKNSTFNNVSGANVSIYEQIMQQNGPPILRIIKSTTTGLDGNFTLLNVRNNRSSQQGVCEGQCDTIYRIQVTLDSAGFVTQVGPTLPPMPREPLVFSMNGGTFYLQNATTLQLYANNVGVPSGGGKQRFGYEVIDSVLGFPIASGTESNVSTVNISVPVGRGYTVMFVRSPSAFAMIPDCWISPGFMNDTSCPSPPISITVNSSCLEASARSTPIPGCNSSEISFSSYLITINKSLVYGPGNLTGCLNIVGNSSEVKLTDIMSKMIPWEGFIPPMRAGVMDFNVSDDDSYAAGNSSGCTLGRYNLSLIGAATGVQFMIEAYANGTNEYFAAFKNITMNITNSSSTNFTLVKLLGQYTTGGEVNTSKIEVAIMDENGTVPEDVHVDVYVRNNELQVFHYIIEDLDNGRFNFLLLNNTKEARARVFSNQFAPKEQKIRLNANRTNVTLYPFKPQEMRPDGSRSNISGRNLTMRFMRNNATCNVYTPPLACRIGTDNNADFDPLKAMMAGKSNLWMKTRTNVTLYFINVDMMVSGPPNAIISNNVSSATASSTSLEQVWKFGSMAPKVYDYVMIGIPYNSSINDSLINESANWTYSVNISVLYDEDWNIIWSAAANGSGKPAALADYSDFNDTWFTSGMNCSTAATPGTQQCFMDRGDIDGHAGYFWLTIPHFSNSAEKITGKSITLSAEEGGTTGGTTGPGGEQATTYDVGTLPNPVTQELVVGEKIRFSVNNTNHTISLLGITATSAALRITAIGITLTRSFTINQAQLVDVNGDGENDIEITLKSANVTGLKATFYLRSLAVAAPSQPTAPSQNITQNVTQPPTQPSQAPPSAPSEEKLTISKWIWVGLALLAAVIVFILISRPRGPRHMRIPIKR